MPQANVPMLPALSVMDELPLGVLDEESSNDSNNEPFSTGSRPLSPILRYEDPILVRPHAGFDSGMGHDSLPQYASLNKAADEQRKKEAVDGARRMIKRPAKNENTAVLKAIIPNREWANDVGEWVQTVSTRERNRVDLDSLRSKVDARLATLQARPGAMCAVREHVFSDLFDELIRGITLECPERGLLLLRLRNEARMNLETYNEIYRDIVVLSSRKAEDARAELDGRQRLQVELEAKASRLKERAKSLDVELDLINRSIASAQANTKHEHAEQLNLLAAEQKVLEAAIAKFRKSPKEATTPAET